MRKEILITFAIASLLLITPLTGIAQENKVSNNLIEQPDIDGLVAQIRTVANEILEKYGHIPIISSLCNMILNSLNLIVLWVICWVIYIICFLFIPIIWFCFLMGLYIGQTILWYILAVAMIIDSECPDLFSPPIKSIYTMLNVDDNTQSFDDCACLQE